MYVIGVGKQIMYFDGVIIFDKHNKQANEADVVSFQNWFNRGYKKRNMYVSLILCARIFKYCTGGLNFIYLFFFYFRKKFNDASNVIRPPFLLGSFPVGSKT